MALRTVRTIEQLERVTPDAKVQWAHRAEAQAAVPWIVDVTKPAAGGGGAAGGSNAMGAARWKKTLQKGEAATQKAAKGKAGAKSTVVQKL